MNRTQTTTESRWLNRTVLGWNASLGISMTVCLVTLCSCAYHRDLNQARSRQGDAGLIVSETPCDLDHDGRTENIEIQFQKGRRHDDATLWCGNGEKWEGDFLICVRRGDKVLSSQSLNRLMAPTGAAPRRLFFWTPNFRLVLDDYNGDGQIDFNLGQYGGCNGNQYKLFTIRKDGTIMVLPVQGTEDGLFVSNTSPANSTTEIRRRDGFLECSHYDNVRGKAVRELYQWDGTRFILVSEVLKRFGP